MRLGKWARWWGRAWCHLTWDREPLGQKPRTILLDLHLTSIVPAAVRRGDLEKNCTGRRNSNWEVSWKLTRDHWGLKSGNRKGGDRLDVSSILGRGRVAWCGGSTDLGREGLSPSSGGHVARWWLFASWTDSSGRGEAGLFFISICKTNTSLWYLHCL